jgi:hypothetical protein
MTEMYKMGGGLVRIGVNRTDVALISFEEWAKTIPPKFAARLRHNARKVSGNCKHHWVACDAVPMERWSAVDTYNGRAWVRTPR